MNPEVYVIIPNWNGREHLAYSLPSLSSATYPSLQVVMVDDCSMDDSCEYVSSHFPFVAILRKSTNSGFAASVNRGIRLALSKGAKYAAIYNSDVRIPPGLFEPVAALLEEKPEIAIAGCTEVPRGDATPICMPQTFQYWDIGTRLPGMLYVCRANVFEDLGLYDECYYMYGEESDLFSRVLRAGYRVVQTNVPVWHYVGASGERVRFKMAWFSYRNAIRYAAKNGTASLALRHTLAMLFYAVTSGGMAPSETRLARTFGGESLRCAGPNAKPLKVESERYRYGHPLVNVAIWFASVCWNIIFLPQTLMARRRDTSKIVRHLQTVNERG